MNTANRTDINNGDDAMGINTNPDHGRKKKEP